MRRLKVKGVLLKMYVAFCLSLDSDKVKSKTKKLTALIIIIFSLQIFISNSSFGKEKIVSDFLLNFIE